MVVGREKGLGGGELITTDKFLFGNLQGGYFNKDISLFSSAPLSG